QFWTCHSLCPQGSGGLSGVLFALGFSFVGSKCWERFYMRQLFLLTLASFCFLNPQLSSTALAHPAIEAQVAIVNEQIEREPANATLYVKRGQLRYQHREWQLA